MLNEGGVYTPADLERRLDVSRGLLGQMLADLERMGYLKQIPTNCPSHCADCPLDDRCAVVEGKHVWSLTAKGRN
jgi:hypothetical protein